jgi:hypothetical protein
MQIKDQLNSFRANLKTFYSGLPEASIKFMYFDALDFDKNTDMTYEDPYVGNVFKKLDLGKRSGMVQSFYILAGKTDGYYYIYSVTGLTYFICPYKPQTMSTANRVRTPLTPAVIPEIGQINHGDHVDFGLRLLRNGVAIKAHKTQYRALADEPGAFMRSAPTCDVTFADAMAGQDIAPLRTSQCFGYASVMTMEQVLDPQSIDVIHHLCKKMANDNSKVSGGGKQKGLPKKVWRDRVLHTGQRGGKYVFGKDKKKKQYIRGLQVGGEGGRRYENVTFLTPAFADFVKTHIIAKVAHAKADTFISARVFYDELGELGSNDFLTLLYDFTDDETHIHYVDMATLLQAVYASHQASEIGSGSAAAPTQVEQAALAFFVNATFELSTVA